MSSSYSFYCRACIWWKWTLRSSGNEVLTENGTEYLNHVGTLNVQACHRYRLFMSTWHDHRTKQSRTANTNMEHQALCPSRMQAPRKLGSFCCMTQNTLFKDRSSQFLHQNHSSYYYLALGALGCFPWSLCFLFVFFWWERTII